MRLYPNCIRNQEDVALRVVTVIGKHVDCSAVRFEFKGTALGALKYNVCHYSGKRPAGLMTRQPKGVTLFHQQEDSVWGIGQLDTFYDCVKD